MSKQFDLSIVLKAVDRISQPVHRAGVALQRFGQKTGLNRVAVATQQVATGFRDVVPAATRAGLAVSAAGVDFFAMVKRSAAAADLLAKNASKLGIGIEPLQKLRYSAELAGISTQALDTGLQRFTRRAAEAAAGTGEAKDALAAMGIQLTDAKGNLRPSEALLHDVADAMSQIDDPAKRLRIAFKLFDTEGAAMVNMLSGGSEALKAQAAELEKLGITTEAQAKLAVNFNDQMTMLEKVFSHLFMTMSSDLMPVFTELVTKLRDFTLKNKEKIIEGVKIAFEALSTAARWAGEAFAYVLDLIGPIAKALMTLVGFIWPARNAAKDMTGELGKMHQVAVILSAVLLLKLAKAVYGLIAPLFKLATALVRVILKMFVFAFGGQKAVNAALLKMRTRIWKAVVAMWAWTKSLALAGLEMLKLAGRSIGAFLVGLVSTVPMLWSAVAATAAWTVALLANPLAWIVVAIVAAIAGLIYAGYQLWKNWDKIKAWGTEVWSAILAKVEETIDGIKSKWTTFKSWLSDMVASLMDIIPDWIKERFNGGDVNINVNQDKRAPTAYPEGAGKAQVGGRVVVEMRNAPLGTQVREVHSDSRDVGIVANVGFAMAAP